jgi:PAS domain S-box-containing protein
MKMDQIDVDCWNNIPMGVFAVDVNMNIILFNPFAEKITGFSKDEALSCKCFEIFRAKRCFRECPLRAALEERDTTGLRARNTILTKDNVEIPIDITASVLTDETGTVTHAIECFQESFPDIISQTADAKYIRPSDPVTFQNIIGKDPKICRIVDILTIAAKTDAYILITGETGVGKDVFAKCIHLASPRKDERFIKVNCAAMPRDLLESELFGYQKGAFTDAKTDKPGRFQMAEGGTIFLDEIAELPLSLQAKLLQVLDEKTFYPLGASKPVVVDVRVLSSTNQHLWKMVEEGGFREDLFYRLNVIGVELPPLRDRPSDIPLLIDQFLKDFSGHRGTVPSIEALSTQASDFLLRYSYPGNIRELKHILEHASIMSQGKTITPAMLPDSLVPFSGRQPCKENLVHETNVKIIDIEERTLIINTLRANNWSRKKTADRLSIDRTTLWRKMKRFGLLG